MLSDLKPRASIRQANLISTLFKKTLVGMPGKVPILMRRPVAGDYCGVLFKACCIEWMQQAFD
jgi:hypothetical protein